MSKHISNQHQLDDQSLQYLNPGHEAEVELVIGFDLGTSSTKVVIRADGLPDSPAWAVPFPDSANPTSPHLLPTRVWLGNGEAASLQQHPGVAPGLRIKERLFFGVSEASGLSDGVPQCREEDLQAVVFIALVLRESRQWFLQTQHIRFRNYRNIVWNLNFGVPSPSLETLEGRDRFLSVVEAAWELSLNDGAITLDLARIGLNAWQYKERDEIFADQQQLGCRMERQSGEIHLIPEIAAAIHGYSVSPSRREGLHLFVDVGATTLDIGLLLPTSSEDGLRYPFLLTDVKHLGTQHLLSLRLQMLKDSVHTFANAILSSHDPLSPPVTQIDGFVPTRDSLVDSVQGAEKALLHECAIAIRKLVWDAKIRRCRHEFDRSRTQRITLLMVGGGSASPYYSVLKREIHNWLRVDIGDHRGIRQEHIELPQNLDYTPDEATRMSVAWGLSHPSWNLGTIIPANEIPDLPPQSVKPTRGDYWG